MHASRSRTVRHALAAVTTGAVLVVPVAATASDTSVSFEVQAGTLSISQAGAATTLDASGVAVTFDATDPATVSGTLPATTVSDTRGTLAGAWTVTVGATGAFTSGSDTVALSNARVFNDAADATALTTSLGGALDGMVLDGGEYNTGTSSLATPYTLLSGTTTLGEGSVTYTPAVTVTVPAGTPPGTYTATVQQTVS